MAISFSAATKIAINIAYTVTIHNGREQVRIKDLKLNLTNGNVLVHVHSNLLNPMMNQLVNQLVNANYFSLVNELKPDIVNNATRACRPIFGMIGNIAVQDFL